MVERRVPDQFQQYLTVRSKAASSKTSDTISVEASFRSAGAAAAPVGAEVASGLSPQEFRFKSSYQISFSSASSFFFLNT